MELTHSTKLGSITVTVPCMQPRHCREHSAARLRIHGMVVQDTQTGRVGVIQSHRPTWAGRPTAPAPFVLVRATDTGNSRYWSTRHLVLI